MKSKLELIPFLKIFATILIGVVASLTIPINISFYPLCLLPIPFITIKRYRNISTYTILALLGASLPYLQGGDKIVLNKNCEMQLVALDTTLRKEIFLCSMPEYDEKALIIFSKPQKIEKGDTIMATILPEDIQFAHYQLKNLTADKDTKYCAKVIGAHTVIPTKTKFKETISLAKKINRWCSNRLQKLNISPSDIAIINGMLLGNREAIDKERKEQYAASGISHMLAISGMHIGIIFMIFNILFIFRNNSYYGRVAGSIAIIAILWAYTIIVGAPISALRATVMFSIMQVGMIRIFSNMQTYNTLFATSTLFLLIDYNVIFDVSFQLSFISILSILLFLPLFKGKNYFLNIIYVTIAAQILTTPLVMHYFGYLSPISLIANLFGSIAIFAIMILSILYIVYPNIALEWVIENIFAVFNYILKFLTDLPYSHIDNINFSTTDVLIYYIITLLIFDIIVSSTKKAI